MIDYRNFKAPNCDKEIQEILRLLGDTFGRQEEDLERKQLSGSESDYNDDYLFTAWEDGKLLGNLHLTINTKNKAFGVLGGLVTVPESRGKGVATKLFGDACEKFDSLGGGLLFLGTGNLMAARMYEKFGFKFISGTVIMARAKGSSLFDMCKNIYCEKEFDLVKMDDGCRIPIIPLIAERGRDILMDANANIINNLYATQISCTGLYPRFLKIKEKGNVWVAKLNNQGICAILTEKIDGDIHNLDCFAYSGYEEILPKMLEKTINSGTKYSAIICKKDLDKLKVFKSFGFVENGEYDYEFNNIHIPCFRLQTS